ncbi:MAG: acyltransferase [Hydrocarboniphaga sp.]|uniref:acyltransferase family protein n=1 Tax=Hydrocarboniphaga sp. TaxID=2033016 RepID=UPI00262817E1|nr:acyltransferase [Hydrocarboniphaga sp.]MDB5969096.1 acyltransferase [Hydrocarboniphaga sp.]
MTLTASAIVRSGMETIPGLNGIRALAVILVFFAHSGLDGVLPGGLGVTVFFVLSGFLITTLMRMEQQRSGGIHFRSFYLRRVVRLMPPLLVIVLIAQLASRLGWIEGRFTPQGFLSVLFYFGNYYVIAHDFAGMPHGLGLTWSLAVEEHFYLLYPPLAAVLLKLNRRKVSATVLGALVAAVTVWRLWLYEQGVGEHYLGMATDTRIDAILIGCLLAVLRNPWIDPVPPQRAGAEVAMAAGCCAVLLVTLLYRDEQFRLTLRYTVQSMAIAPLLWLAVARADSVWLRWLNARPMVYLGTVSYALYLSHHMILLGLQYHWPHADWALTTVIAATMTLAVCEAMRRWVEEPCAAMRKRLHRRALTSPAGTAVARVGGSAPGPVYGQPRAGGGGH